jgi:dsDNA-specific endonuclease/ATPase MutS2
MTYNFKIGDKVKFLKSNDFGTIVKIISERKIQVEDSSLFLTVVNVKDIVKFDNNTDTVQAYGDIMFSKESKENTSAKKMLRQNLNEVKIDLHIENLSNDFLAMSNFEIVQVQIKKCEDALINAMNSNAQKFIIVHGIGEGVLKKEVHNLLTKFELRYFISINGGSTEVML